MTNMEGEDSAAVPAGVVAFLLAQVGGLAAMKFAERLSPLELRPSQMCLLRAVAREPGRSQRALAEQLGTLPSRLVILIDELEAAGLLERRVSATDRRVSELHLTSAGTQMMRRVGRVAQAHGDELLAALDADERSALAELLRKVADDHGLTPGVHPGYRTLGPPGSAQRTTEDENAG
jgi:DNA-binding MarR family transcriptional regulator